MPLVVAEVENSNFPHRVRDVGRRESKPLAATEVYEEKFDDPARVRVVARRSLGSRPSMAHDVHREPILRARAAQTCLVLVVSTEINSH